MSRDRSRDHNGLQPERPGNPNPPPKPDFLGPGLRITPAAVRSPAQWEYRELGISTAGIPSVVGCTWQDYLEELNQLGQHGWELAAVFDRDPVRLVLKRVAQR